MKHLLHFAIAASVSAAGLNLPHGTLKQGTVFINDAEEAAVKIGLEVGQASGFGTPDGHGGEDIKFSATVPGVKLLSFLPAIPVSGEVDLDVWIEEIPA